MKSEEEKKKLVEEVGLSFERKHNFAPLAARIYALMILCPYEGHTFEQIIDLTNASKSSVSTSLNLLLQLRYVEYFTETGDRKRHFRSTKHHLQRILEEQLISVQEDLSIVQKLNKFNCAHNPRKFIKNESIGLIFQEYLISQERNIKTTIQKMLAFQTEDTAI